MKNFSKGFKVYTIFDTKKYLIDSAYLGDFDRWVLVGKTIGGLLPFWGEFFAVTTPWCIELD